MTKVCRLNISILLFQEQDIQEEGFKENKTAIDDKKRVGHKNEKGDDAECEGQDFEGKYFCKNSLKYNQAFYNPLCDLNSCSTTF